MLTAFKPLMPGLRRLAVASIALALAAPAWAQAEKPNILISPS